MWGFVYGNRRAGAPIVTLSLALSNPAIASLSAATIVLGGSSFSSAVYLAASDSGDTVLSASSDGPPMRDSTGISFSFIYPTFTLADFDLGKDLERQVTLQTSINVGALPLPFTVTSDDPQSLCFPNAVAGTCSGSIDVPARSPSFVVRGLSDSGSVQIHYSNPKMGSGGASAHLTRAKIFVNPPAGLTAGISTTVPVSYGATSDTRSGSALRSGFDPGLVVTSSDPTVISVSTNTPQLFSIRAVAPGQATVTVSAPGFDSPDPFAITVTAPAAAVLNVPTTAIFLGKNLQTSIYVTAPALPSQSQIHISSSDPSLLLVSTDSATLGSSQADSNSSYASFSLQALADSGAVTVTLSAAGAANVTIPIRLGPSGFAWFTSAAAVSANSSATISFGAYYLDPNSLAPVQVQQVRAGVIFKPSVSSSNPAAGTLALSAASVLYNAGAPGTTVLSLTQPTGFVRPVIRGDIKVIVNPATVSATVPLFLGKDLQIGFTTSSGNAKFPVTVRSDDPSRLLISSSPSSVGVAQLDTTLGASLYLQALAADGTAMIRISGSGVDDAAFPVTLVAAGVGMFANGTVAGPFRLTTLSPDLTLSASLFVDAPVSYYQSAGVALRAGANPLQVAVTSTRPDVANPLSTTLTFSPGQTSPVSFNVRPLDPGDAVVNLAPPSSFHAGAGVSVKVAQPSFLPATLTVGKDFEIQGSLQLDSSVSLPSTIIVTITSSDPSRVLLSTRLDQPGQTTIAVAYGNNAPTAFFIQGVALGQASVTATTPGFDPATFNVNVTPPSFLLSGPQTAFVGQPSAASISFNGQMVRPGAQISIALHSSDPTIATIDSQVAATGAKVQVSAVIQPLQPGTTTITADLPDGFADTPDSRTFNLAVKLPSLPINGFQSVYAIGKDLQANASLFQTGSGTINLTITSSDPSKVLLSGDAAKAGQAALLLPLDAYRQTPFYVQALTGSGSATLTFSAAGYASSQATVNLYPSAFAFEGTQVTTARSNPIDLSVSVTPVLPSGAAFTNGASLRGGIASLSVPLTSSQPAVGTIVPATLTFNGGDSRATAKFTPAITGNTILTITEPSGFAKPTTNSQLVVVVN